MDEWFIEHGGALLWGALLGFTGALIVAYVFYRLSIRPKKVDWLPVSATPILRIVAEQRANYQDLRVTLGKVPVENPNLILLRIVNTGTSAMRQEDFDPPIAFDFGEVPVIRASIADRAKKTSTIVLDKVSDSKYSLSVSSLNPGQWIDVQFMARYLRNPVVTLNYGQSLDDVIGKVVQLDERHAMVKYMPGKCPRYKHVLANGHIENMVANSENPVGYRELVELTIVQRELVKR